MYEWFKLVCKNGDRRRLYFHIVHEWFKSGCRMKKTVSQLMHELFKLGCRNGNRRRLYVTFSINDKKYDGLVRIRI